MKRMLLERVDELENKIIPKLLRAEQIKLAMDMLSLNKRLLTVIFGVKFDRLTTDLHKLQ